MGYSIKRGQTAQSLVFLMIDSADHIAPKTGLSPTLVLSKNGGAFATPAGVISEVGNGWYKVGGSAADSDTLGPLLLHATAAGADPTDDRFDVVAYDPQSATNLGLSALPMAAAGAAGGLPTGDAAGRVSANVEAWLGAAPATPAVAGVPAVDITHVNGQAAETSADPVTANITQILGSPLTETATGRVAGNLGLFFDNAGAATTKVVEDVSTGAGGDASAANQGIIINHLTDIKGATFAAATDSLAAIRARGDTAWTTARGFSTFNPATDPVTVGANNDKAGYTLSAAGLDAIVVADPGTPANHTTLPRMVVALWRRAFKKSSLTSSQLMMFADDGLTVTSTQAVHDDGTSQTMDAAR